MPGVLPAPLGYQYWRPGQADVDECRARSGRLGALLIHLTTTSPESRTLIRVSWPRKVRSITMPLPAGLAVIRSASGRTSTSTTATGPLPARRQDRARAGRAELLRRLAGIRFMVPTNSATNAVAGWA